MDPCDQFYILSNQYKPIRKPRSPEPQHIESLDELETATAALIVSRDPPRPWKSSLAKAWGDNGQRTTNRVRFSSHVSIRIIPARKLPILELHDIMAATDDEFASFLGRQPDSPAPWRSSKASWRSRELSAPPVAPRKPLRRLIPSTHSTQVKPIRSAGFCGNGAASQLSASSWRGQCSTKQGVAPRTACVNPRYMRASGPQAQHVGTMGSTSSSIRSRQAFLRHLRQLRQQHAAQLHDTPLRRRRLERHRLARGQRANGVNGQFIVADRHICASDRSDHVRSVPGSIECPPFPSLDQGEIQRPPYTSSDRDAQLARSVSPRVKTYVDHIRQQRSPLKPLHAHFVSEPIRKVLGAF